MILHQINNSRSNYNYNAYIYYDIFWQPHFHANFELMYVYEGSAEISINGISDTLCKGELVLLSPYTVHSFTIKGGKTWVGVFSEDYISSFSKKYKYVKFSKFRCSSGIEKILQTYLFYQGTPERFMCMSCLYMVCYECLNNASHSAAEQNNKFIEKVVTYVCENLSKDIDLKGTAEFMNYEYHYFSSLFNQSFAMNFKDFLNRLRIEKACELLREDENSVTNIAQYCGFGSIRNFNRAFKKVCGCTPCEYKKSRLLLT